MVLHSRTITNFTKQKSRHGCRKGNGSQATSRLFNTRNGATATSVNYAFFFSNYYLSIQGFVCLENVNYWHIAYKYMRMKRKYENLEIYVYAIWLIGKIAIIKNIILKANQKKLSAKWKKKSKWNPIWLKLCCYYWISVHSKWVVKV